MTELFEVQKYHTLHPKGSNSQSGFEKQTKTYSWKRLPLDTKRGNQREVE